MSPCFESQLTAVLSSQGDDCPFRHCQLALGSEITCTHWQNGKCLRPSVCKYRHMESRINRSSIQCWFETQPMGCRKPHCVFLHKKPRTLPSVEEPMVSTDGLILPVATPGQNSSSGTSADNNDNIQNNIRDNTLNANTTSSANLLKRGDDSASKMKLFDDSDYLNQSLSSFNESSANIEPISISLNDCDEESDNESERNSERISNVSPNKINTDYNSGQNYGIKTLEQIRMEKVFNSETEDSHIDEQCFDTYSKNDSQLKTQQKQIKNNSKDLRVKIKRQKFSNNNNETMSSVSFLNRNSLNTSSEPSGDFAVKTLDQIRKEREDLAKKSATSTENQSGLKENQEPRGQKRSSSDPNPPVVKIRRSGPIAITSLKVQQNSNENTDNCNKNDANSEPTLMSDESSNQSNVVSSTDTNRKHRITSIDTDLDEFDLFDGESAENLDSNEAIDDDDDELMREINQVINS